MNQQHSRAAAGILSLLTLWRLDRMMGLSSFSEHALSIALAVGLFFLLERALACRDKRLMAVSGVLGGLFAAITLIGQQLTTSGAFGAFSVLGLLDVLMTLIVFTLVYGAALVCLYQGAEHLRSHQKQRDKESLLSRITGNWFVVFVFLVACWVPAWLAFWPGSFLYDSVTQFYTYLDWAHNSHHPLLHTLLLGFCVMTGIDMDPEGYATYGVAIYSAVQIVLLAAMVAFACRWLRKRQAPLWARLAVTLLFGLFPFYQLWPFSAQKDILFAGLVLWFVLDLVDLWREGWPMLRSPWRILRFLITAGLMMLMRNNGAYALALLIPVALLLAKGARVRMGALLLAALAVYWGANAALVHTLEAESGSKVEILSIPLQQIARTLRDHPDQELTEEEQELMDSLYSDGLAQYYTPEIADPVKWAIDYDVLEESVPQLLKMWARLAVQHPITYLEAFLCQNLPYLLPGAEMIYRFDIEVIQIDIYPIQEFTYFPKLRELYLSYDQSLQFLDLPGVRLLSDTAFQVWLCLAAVGFAIWRREWRWLSALGFLLTIWLTCLLGPVALIRYMLSFFYCMPVLLAAMLKRMD